jgi:glutamine synthetase
MVVKLTRQVLLEYVRKEDLTVPQAIRVVQDLLFNTSNLLYNLNLPLKPLSLTLNPNPSSDLNILLSFLDEQPSTKFLRLSYLDFTATPRVRVVPVKHALTLLRNRGSLKIGITKACLGLLQNDTFIPGVTAAGEYRLHAIFSSIRPGPSKNYASLQCEFLEQDNSEVAICPRSLLRRTVQNAKAQELEFLLGFEIEVVFMSPAHDGQHKFVANSSSAGHAWNSARAFQEKAFLPILDEIYDTLTHSGIHIELFHPESSAGQYEFVLPALPPVEAVDTLLHAREIISTVAASHSLRATLFPKPFPLESGTASHVHISISSPKGDDREVYESFYAGVLRHLRAIIAFTYSNPASYDRMVDGCWAGGRWVTWGTQNREAALRKIAGSHWEVKVLDGLANAYLAMASIIAAGTDGVARSEPLIWRDCTKDPATLSAEERTSLGIGEELPRDLFAAIEALAEDEILRDMLGNEVLQRYISVKMADVKLLDTMADHDRRDWIIDRY